MTVAAPLHFWQRGEGTPLLLIHGFAGHGESWGEVVERLPVNRTIASLTLPGHDSACRIERAERFEEVLAQIISYIKTLVATPFEAVGYSMGARVGLALLARRPELVSRAVLIGVNPGIEADTEREERARWDQEWADLLVEKGIRAFVERWEKLPLLATQGAVSPAAAARQRAIRLRHDSRQLATTMLTLGLSAMPNYWPDLPRIHAPVRLVAGERDDKFRAIAERMSRSLPHAETIVIPGAGHNPVLEKPREIARILGT